MRRRALFYVGVIRDLVLRKHLFHAHGIILHVRKKNGNVAITQTAIKHFALDHCRNKRKFVLFIRRLEHAHAVGCNALSVCGIEKTAAQTFRLRTQFGRETGVFALRARKRTATLKIAPRLVGVDILLSADKHPAHAFGMPDRGADPFRSLSREGRKTRKYDVRAAECSAPDLFGKQGQDPALVHVTAFKEGKILAVDKSNIRQFFGEHFFGVPRRFFQHFGRDERRAQLGNGFIKTARTACGVLAETP